MARKKQREHIKRFLSNHRPASQSDEVKVRVLFNQKKVAIKPFEYSSDNDGLDRITYDQVESWYNSRLPNIGEVIKCEKTGYIGLVVKEKWNSFIIGAALSPDNTLVCEEQPITDTEYTEASRDEILALQRALSKEGKEWHPERLCLIQRAVPDKPRYVRLLTMGELVGIGIFQEITPEGELKMVCLIRGSDRADRGTLRRNVSLGDAGSYTFSEILPKQRIRIQDDLAAQGYVWNSRRHRLEKNKARAKEGKRYYYVDNYLRVKQNIEGNKPTDRLRFNKGNYFLNRTVAERACDKMVLICREEMISEDNC